MSSGLAPTAPPSQPRRQSSSTLFRTATVPAPAARRVDLEDGHRLRPSRTACSTQHLSLPAHARRAAPMLAARTSSATAAPILRAAAARPPAACSRRRRSRAAAHVVAPPHRARGGVGGGDGVVGRGARCSAPTARARGAARRLRVGRLVVGIGPLPARGIRLGEAPVAAARALCAIRVHARLPRRRVGARHPRQRRPRPPRDAPAPLGRPPRAPLRRRVRGGNAKILDQR